MLSGTEFESCENESNGRSKTWRRKHLRARIIGRGGHEDGYGLWDVVIHPRDNKCEKISLPKTKEELVETARTLGIEWELDEVINIEEAEDW